MRKLGKFGCAVVLGCLLSLALVSTGAFAQSASYQATQQATAAHISQNVQNASQANGWGRGRLVRVVRWVRQVRLVRETRVVRVVRVIRQVRFVRVTRLVRQVRMMRQVRFVRVGCGNFCR